MRYKPATVLLHTALTIILVGACVTHFFGEQGQIHLRADKAETVHARNASVSLFLWDFQVLCDGEGNPRDFVSDLRLLDRRNASPTIDAGTVRMNAPLRYHGFRFCQLDYDTDLRGVQLAYNYDPWGIGITYTGYALLLLGMVGFFFQRHTRFRALIRKQHAWWLSGLAAVVIVLAIIMTRVVTPKPPLLPVLQTPLLGIHVSVIMLAYTLFAVIMILGIVGLANPRHSSSTLNLSTILLYPALFCLTAGIFIGAVWANLSWGRYWGWDPKETWALITMLVYAALLHLSWFKRYEWVNRHYTTLFHTCSIAAFFFVLFTYFGVSYLLGGLHAYA